MNVPFVLGDPAQIAPTMLHADGLGRGGGEGRGVLLFLNVFVCMPSFWYWESQPSIDVELNANERMPAWFTLNNKERDIWGPNHSFYLNILPLTYHLPIYFPFIPVLY